MSRKPSDGSNHLSDQSRWIDVPWQQLRDEDVASRTRTSRLEFRPRTSGQIQYQQVIESSTLTLCTGPAGSGKSHVPMALGLRQVEEKKVGKLVLCRPMQECGRQAGWFPGDLGQKIAPYFRPLLDILEDLLGPEDLAGWLREGKVVLAPLEFLRGCTLKNSFVLADEAQNYSRKQLLMLLTRIGEGCRMVVAGGLPAQADLEFLHETALQWVMRGLLGEEDIGQVRLTEDDICRPDLVRRIVRRLGEG